MMLRKILLLAGIVASLSARPALPQIYSTAVKPPSVIVSDESGNELDRIPLPDRSLGMAYSKAANRVYVFHEAKEGGSISVVDPAEHRVEREISLRTPASARGEELAARLTISGDGRRLFCYIAPMFTKGFPGMTRLDLKPESQPVISVLDTSSNEVVTTYSEWWSSLHTAIPKGFVTGANFAANQDGSQLLAFFRPFNRWPHPVQPEEIFVFSGNASPPAFKMDPGGHVVNAVLSRDGKFLITAVDKGKESPGVVVTANMESSSIVSRSLTDRPRVFVRLGQLQSLWVLGEREMRPVSESGELGERAIPLNQPRKSEEGDSESTEALLNGYPGETISLGESRTAVLILNQNGASAHRLALIDLSQFRLDAIVATMSPSEIRNIHAKRFLGALAANVAIGAAFGAAGAAAGNPLLAAGSPTLMPGGLTNEALAARPDGKYLYALDTDIHAVTVIDVDAASVFKRIPVDRSVIRMQVSADGKNLLCIGKKNEKSTKLNMSSNSIEE